MTRFSGSDVPAAVEGFKAGAARVVRWDLSGEVVFTKAGVSLQAPRVWLNLQDQGRLRKWLLTPGMPTVAGAEWKALVPGYAEDEDDPGERLVRLDVTVDATEFSILFSWVAHAELLRYLFLVQGAMVLCGLEAEAQALIGAPSPEMAELVEGWSE